MSRTPVRFAGIVPVAACWLALSGCVDAPRVQTLAVQPNLAQLQTARGVRANYVYYPDYEVYYSRNYQQYVFRYNYAWMTQGTPPPGLPPAVLESARTVPMVFHDEPSRHHAEVVLIFPRTPKPAHPAFASSN